MDEIVYCAHLEEVSPCSSVFDIGDGMEICLCEACKLTIYGKVNLEKITREILAKAAKEDLERWKRYMKKQEQSNANT